MNKQAWEAKLQKMTILEKGWNSYKAEPPSEESIANARAFLELKPDPNRCEPSAMGGVGITYRNGRRTAFVEFYNKASCKIAVLLADGVAMNVVKSNTPEPIVAVVNKYLASIPVLTREEIDAVKSSEDLDVLIAKHVFDFPGLGYYRRKSAYDNTEPMYELCDKDDHTPDMPAWKASVMYNHCEWQRSVNCFSTDGTEALSVMQAMLIAARKYATRFILNLTYDNGSNYGVADVVTYTASVLKNINPKQICLAALYAIAEISSNDNNGE